MKSVVLVGALAAMSGCAMELREEIQSRYIGKSVDVAIDHLGFPAREDTIAGHHIVVWETSAVPPFGPPVNLRCTLKLEIDDAKIVRKFSYDGQSGACDNFRS
jgi:hypothetical protein